MRFRSMLVVAAALVAGGILAPTIGDVEASAATYSPSSPQLAAHVTGTATARFAVVGALAPGQTAAVSVQLPDGNVVHGSVSEVSETADWSNVYSMIYTCTTSFIVTTSWFHVYEGMQGNSSTVTNVDTPNEYWSTGPLPVTSRYDPAPHGYIRTPAHYGHMITGTEFSGSVGPINYSNTYYYSLVVRPDGSLTSSRSYFNVSCNAL